MDAVVPGDASGRLRRQFWKVLPPVVGQVPLKAMDYQALCELTDQFS
jgi:hypothetical protein